ncbi:beta-propeller domain-containing protein [Aurantiacibacter sp. MUD61]|uniref:beta-propeller domain-containing protein n=1 Tax=Aurantiacibacter sp. MUD61 TaxID=3009083 RepID=UPI0022F06F86|nr:beta-propeller domain-containing protein [Aurantiacibacter sp. MUD61]
MRLGLLAATCALLPFSAAQAQGTWDHPYLEDLATPELQTFENEREFRRWVRDLRSAQRYIRDNARAELPPEIYVAALRVDRQDPDCNPLYENCPATAEDGSDRIVVTGSRVRPSTMSSPMAVTVADAESITNNQSSGVDEGDIVKRMGDYLLVLQDGRIFVANFRTMELTDRIDVYRTDEDGDPIGADWYDEMLVQGDHIIITAYSYYDDASELSVFRLNRENGTVERRGVFLISSEDYYDVDNYATRVIGDQLVIYTPYDPTDLVNRRNRPSIRRWVPSDDFDDEDRGRAILDVRDIYRPVFGTFDPIVHTISRCDLGGLEEDNLTCDSTAFIAGEAAEMFVSPENIFLATTAAGYNDISSYRICRSRSAGFENNTEPPPGAVFRIPMRRPDEVDLLAVRGVVFDQFSMDQQNSRFRMLTSWQDITCTDSWWRSERERSDIELVDVPLVRFGTRYSEPDDGRFTTLPEVNEGFFENRFVGEWLLYGSRTRYGRPPEAEEGDVFQSSGLMAVPLGEPDDAQRVPLSHEITRIESLGGDAIVNGYRDDTGLIISYLDLAETAQVADAALLPGRFESESRSHAFNATIYADGDGLMGLPTVRSEHESGRYYWRSDNSDISFLRFSPSGQLTDLSDVSPAPQDDKSESEYECEVSCVDWYGNARPIFIGEGVYALMGTELVEARALEDRVEVLRRLDLTAE